MLADGALAVHPEDERYKHLIGKTVTIPLNGREIPIIADGLLVDPALTAFEIFERTVEGNYQKLVGVTAGRIDAVLADSTAIIGTLEKPEFKDYVLVGPSITGGLLGEGVGAETRIAMALGYLGLVNNNRVVVWAFDAAGGWSDRVPTMWDWDLALRADASATRAGEPCPNRPQEQPAAARS